MINQYTVTATFKINADDHSDAIDFAHDLQKYGSDKSYVVVDDFDSDVVADA